MTLEWIDIDFERQIIKIRTKDNWTPKTSERNIPMSGGLIEILRRHRENTENGPFVFHENNGKKIEKSKLRKKLIQTAKKGSFPDVTKLHTLRHTFASHLVMSGVDLPSVKQLLGHADIATTMIYAHLAPDHLNKAVDKLNF